MNEEEKDLIETFRKLRPDIRQIMLVQASASLAMEETAQKQCGILPAGRGLTQRANPLSQKAPGACWG